MHEADVNIIVFVVAELTEVINSNKTCLRTNNCLKCFFLPCRPINLTHPLFHTVKTCAGRDSLLCLLYKHAMKEDINQVSCLELPLTQGPSCGHVHLCREITCNHVITFQCAKRFDCTTGLTGTHSSPCCTRSNRADMCLSESNIKQLCHL